LRLNNIAVDINIIIGIFAVGWYNSRISTICSVRGERNEKFDTLMRPR